MAKNGTPILQNLENPDTRALSELFARVAVKKKKGTSRKRKSPPPIDPEESARNAKLRYVTDAEPGYSRKKSGKNFAYFDTTGKRIRDENEVQRIRALAIPPAWKDVWISPHPQGHLQATGRDAKGRKQYRYHPRWREVRDCTKFDRMVAFGEALPLIREQVEKDLSLTGLPKEKVLATIVRLLEITLIRVGNEEYAKANNSYGLTTMRNRHLEILGSQIRFRFRGKSGKQHDVGIKNSRLARILKKCQEIPGYELFQYIDPNGEPVSVDSSDVNEYLRAITQHDFSAKDFRTWVASVLTAMALHQIASADSGRVTKKNITQAVTMVAKLLGNTPTICRKSYIHPALVNGSTNGKLWKTFQKESELIHGLAPEEVAVLAYLRTASG